ncbi:MAG: protein nirF [SAR324 cluster bacterium]|nr:protein nirF [SAR324 cluster bacterium]
MRDRKIKIRFRDCLVLVLLWSTPIYGQGTGTLGVVIERNTGGLVILDTEYRKILRRVEHLGDLSHATIVFSRNEQFAYTFQRDGWVHKVDLLSGKKIASIQAGKNSIGGAISQDGKYLAVSNYEPGDVRILDSQSLEILKIIPADYTDAEGKTQTSRTVGLVDAPEHRFIFSLMDGGEIWVVSSRPPDFKILQQWKQVGNYPYDAFLTSEGRYYLAGFLKSNQVVRLDLWNMEAGPQPVSTLDANLESPKVPMYKVPHLSGWGMADGKAFTPVISEERLMVYELKTWSQLQSIAVYGTVVFAVPRPDERELWLTFAGPKNDTLQIIDVATFQIRETIKLGRGISHIHFTPKGDMAYVSVRTENKLMVLDAYTHEIQETLEINGPSGIFMVPRAHRIGL